MGSSVQDRFGSMTPALYPEDRVRRVLWAQTGVLRAAWKRALHSSKVISHTEDVSPCGCDGGPTGMTAATV